MLLCSLVLKFLLWQIELIDFSPHLQSKNAWRITHPPQQWEQRCGQRVDASLSIHYGCTAGVVWGATSLLLPSLVVLLLITS